MLHAAALHAIVPERIQKNAARYARRLPQDPASDPPTRRRGTCARLKHGPTIAPQPPSFIPPPRSPSSPLARSPGLLLSLAPLVFFLLYSRLGRADLDGDGSRMSALYSIRLPVNTYRVVSYTSNESATAACSKKKIIEGVLRDSASELVWTQKLLDFRVCYLGQRERRRSTREAVSRTYESVDAENGRFCTSAASVQFETPLATSLYLCLGRKELDWKMFKYDGAAQMSPSACRGRDFRRSELVWCILLTGPAQARPHHPEFNSSRSCTRNSFEKLSSDASCGIRTYFLVRCRLSSVSPGRKTGTLWNFWRPKTKKSAERLSLKNILGTPSQRACIAEFGLSRIAKSTIVHFSQATSSMQAGTARYQALELFQVSDSLQIVTEKVPFHGKRNDMAVMFVVPEGQCPPQPAWWMDTRELDSLWWMMEK
ncbi:hypothetical protein DFH08DRAFT_1013312 [Mycena albidolilacea]|uniref:Uncharacterized protein n=1 Tax=Mycena albidolilacea TaxID=1033008 RepID=A0AAD6ZUM3_9AGAR|nr:hypothetical protein DFH08DRAFT_1013312 [Mycena albidolilacea]